MSLNSEIPLSPAFAGVTKKGCAGMHPTVTALPYLPQPVAERGGARLNTQEGISLCEEDAMPDARGEATIRPDSTLDATGLLCPLPVLKVCSAVSSSPSWRESPEVLATDPGATRGA